MEKINMPVESEEYYAALSTARRAKNCLWWLIVLCVGVQMAAFVSVRFVGVVNAAPQLAGIVPAQADQPTTSPAQVAEDKAPGNGWIWYQVLRWALPATKFIAMASGDIACPDDAYRRPNFACRRTGGTAGFTGGFFWSLLLLVFLIPGSRLQTATLPAERFIISANFSNGPTGLSGMPNIRHW